MPLLYKCRQRFLVPVNAKFKGNYLHRHGTEDARHIVDRHRTLCFPGALGSLDCSAWKLHSASVEDQRKTIGKSGVPEFGFESWCDDRLWVR